MTTPFIATFVHVHYPDIWAEMQTTLAERIGLPFHLILTSSRARDEITVPEADNLLSTRFIPVENRGRDILPFLTALDQTPDFDIGLKLHTKKSPQRLDGDAWRGAVLDALAPSPTGTGDIVGRIQADRRVGFVTPAGFALSVKPWVLVNAPGMAAVMQGLGHALRDDDLEDCFFAAGSMFWFRRAALAALARQEVRVLFEPEEAQLDGTAAHAMERLFPVEARRQGYVSLSTAALAEATPALPLPALLALARRHADIPSTFFPAPYVEALPPGSALPGAAAEPPPPPSPLRAAYHRLPPGLRLALRRLMGR